MIKDERLSKLAKNILTGSISLQKGEKIYLEARGGSTLPLLEEFIAEAVKLGAVPFYSFNDNSMVKSFVINASKEQIQAKGEFDKKIMEACSSYIGIRGDDDIFQLSDVPSSQMTLYQKYYSEPVHSQTRVGKTKWCVMRYPNNAMAALSKMSLESFENFYFNACLVDYKKMGEAMDGLVNLMDKTDKVKIISPTTNLEFSIKNIKAIKCDGEKNIPDGEVYTAPVKDSINGYVEFNADSAYLGSVFSNVWLKFENGKIVEGKSHINNDKLQDILNTDVGSRYIGEFALGVNPYITKPILDILFDEKISGSFHMAIGNSYEDADNGNKSAVHWDLVQMQTPHNGGGEIYFDNVLIRKDGLFVIEELKALNPDRLK